MRIGGRIQNAKIPEEIKYPVVLTKKSHITNLIVYHFNAKTLYQGRGMPINETRNNGFWIKGCSCCFRPHQEMRSLSQTARFASRSEDGNLPFDRLEPASPFTYCAVDFFGPFNVKEDRKELERYGVLFAYLLRRASSSMLKPETDSFFNPLRRVIAIRGPIRQLRSDKGTNFVGTENEKCIE